MRYRNLIVLVTLLATPAVLGNPLLGLPAAPPTDPLQVSLGKKLFFDAALSANGTLSCAMCHIPEQGYAQNQLATSVGFLGRTVKRNSPTLLNVGYREILFHDGREFTLENQVWSPLLSNREMGNVSIGAVIQRITDLERYQGAFEAAFGETISVTTIGRALAAYERTLIAAESPFDQWYYGKNDTAVNGDVKQGFVLFNRHGCTNCHSTGEQYAHFTDDSFHNTGIGFERSMKTPIRETKTIKLANTISIQTTQSFEVESLNDLGRYEMTGIFSDKWKYRTPTLRNIALTAPYMHDGSLSSLEDVIEFYMQGGIQNEGLDEKILPFKLSGRDQKQIVLFLRSLTSPNVDALITEARKPN